MVSSSSVGVESQLAATLDTEEKVAEALSAALASRAAAEADAVEVRMPT